MLIRKLTLLLVVISTITVLSCTICDKGDAHAFHKPIGINFENENTEPLIGPTEKFDFFKSALYDEEGSLVDTSFTRLIINDWKENWTEENVKHSRSYELHLVERVQGQNVGKDFTYQLGINYWLEANDCRGFDINRIQILINDSLQIDSDYFSSTFNLLLPE